MAMLLLPLLLLLLLVMLLLLLLLLPPPLSLSEQLPSSGCAIRVQSLASRLATSPPLTAVWK
jgi:hypothetical protein